ncbi:peptidoglycan-binding domain-containing protein [Actinoplanes sp. ATCC 53533]|uniref:peptidoglycan-binding domain-containing protein n=1 Tax=Actinoplanes sp. ATCC 53533 TaxID=1288362 RepID=UPI001F36754C|nr:peptidoglycan-binding domain-containing protein [Actinoplanes sp. ATCC 53533]
MTTTTARTEDLAPPADPGKPAGRRDRRRVRTAAGVCGAALVVVAGTVAAVGFGDGDTPATARADLPPATATVAKTTLTQTETVDGTLGYGDTTVVKARGGTNATVTWLPAEGSTVSRGRPVYKADSDPVVLLYGSAPLYRTLEPGAEGADVKLVERNLSALGYDGFTVDDEYTSATADAVRDWQDDLGLSETGTVAPAQVVVATGRIRVTALQLALGDTANGPVLSYSGTTRTVTVHLDVDKQELAKKGIAATVELPDGTPVKGTVTSVGTVATTTGTDNQQTTTIDVTVTVADQKKLGTLDEAPVDVILQAEQRRDVLAVPVNALVALAEGGYGLQAVDGSTTRYVAVKTGMFAGNKVEVSGTGVTDGLVVGVPR